MDSRFEKYGDMKNDNYATVWLESIAEVTPPAWDALAVPLKTPFLEWEWLNHLEVSGSITAQTGWQPHHLTVWSGRRLVAAAPLYIKSHSAGEFVYDLEWAQLAGHMNIDYYPKLVGMSPVTPAIGYRFMIASDQDEEALTGIMIKEIDRFCLTNRISGCSFLFVDPDWQALMIRHGFRHWLHQSFAWQNQDYKDFDDYLAIFNSNQRRNIKRERSRIKELGLFIKAFSGDEIPRTFLSLIYRFYTLTNDRFGIWNCKYLTRAFFDGLYHCYRHRLVIMAAFHRRNQQMPAAMSLLLTKGDLLFGRYWGSFKKIDSLHFNTCYYSPIEWAIANDIKWFDPGIGSEHKLRRGFRAIANFSLHKFYVPQLQQLLQMHIGRINRMALKYIEDLNEALPFVKL